MTTDPTAIATTPTIPEPVPDTVAVWVPQPDGEIQIASAGDAAVVHTVREHIVDVLRDAAAHFLRVVPGAILHDPAASAGPPPEGEPPDHQTPEAAARDAAARETGEAPERAGGTQQTTSSRARTAAPTAPESTTEETAPKPGA